MAPLSQLKHGAKRMWLYNTIKRDQKTVNIIAMSRICDWLVKKNVNSTFLRNFQLEAFRAAGEKKKKKKKLGAVLFLLKRATLSLTLVIFRSFS